MLHENYDGPGIAPMIGLLMLPCKTLCFVIFEVKFRFSHKADIHLPPQQLVL